MITPAQALFDILPQVPLGKDQGLVPPAATHSTFSVTNTEGGLTWDVPLNMIPWWSPTQPTAYSTATLDQLLLWEASAVLGIWDTVRRGWPYTRQRGGITLSNEYDAYLPLLPDIGLWDGFGRDAFPQGSYVYFDEVLWKSTDVRGEMWDFDLIQPVVSSTAEPFFKAVIPQLTDYGERIRIAERWVKQKENLLFNYPQGVLDHREYNSKIFRILCEAAKTPASIVLKSGGNHEVVLKDGGTSPAVGSATVPACLQFPGIRVVESPFDDSYLFGSYTTREWPPAEVCGADGWQLPTAVKSCPAAIFDPTPTQLDVLKAVQAERMAAISMGEIGEALEKAIVLATLRLNALSVPRFRVPDKWGGGLKYVALVPHYFVTTGTLSDIEKDVLVIGLPAELLAAATYPYPITPYSRNGCPPSVPATADADMFCSPTYPLGTAYVMGWPGVIKFTPPVDDKLTPYTREFGTVGHMAWEDLATYSSARAPRGKVLSSSGSPSVTSQEWKLASWQMSSMDTIKIMSETLIYVASPPSVPIFLKGSFHATPEPLGVFQEDPSVPEIPDVPEILEVELPASVRVIKKRSQKKGRHGASY